MMDQASSSVWARRFQASLLTYGSSKASAVSVTLEAYLDAYIEAAGLRDGGKSPLFRSAAGRTGTLTAKGMNRVDAWRMIQRRAVLRMTAPSI
jgi:hypothetical protein